ncbi:MAG: hypothetical protein IJ391_08195 [Clostridia bacterium]|nr:hypothetical protein [Clostridia bacterium]
MKKFAAFILAAIMLLSVLPLGISADDEIFWEHATPDIIADYEKDADAIVEKIKNSPTSITVTGTTYYVSNNGNDNRDGKTPETAWKTLDRVSRQKYNSGDAVLFERGGLWRGSIGMAVGVTYSAYGEGEKPRFYGSVNASGAESWSATRYPNVWVYNEKITSSKDVGQVVFNGGEAWGIKAIKNQHGSHVDIGTVSNGIDTFGTSSYKFYDQRDLRYNLQYYHNWVDARLYIYCEYGNPGAYFDDIEIALKMDGFYSTSRGVTIDNLCFRYYGRHAISMSNAQNCTIQNCVFEYIGGSMQYTNGTNFVRLGNAVQNWGSCDGFYIRDCYATQIYDCCWTSQWSGADAALSMKNVEVSGCVAKYSNTGLEFWLGSSVNGDHKYENVDLHHNYTFYGGYGWSHQRQSKSGNFFYGGSGQNDTKHINYNVHDNVNVIAVKYGLLARYIKEGYGFTNSNNVYVMELDKIFARTGADLSDLTGADTEYIYNKETIELMIDQGIEKTSSKFYYILPGEYTGVDSAYDAKTGELTVPVSSESERYFTAEELYENDDLLSSDLPKTLIEENGKKYVRFTAAPGAYTNNYAVLYFKGTGMPFNPLDYSFVKVGYKTDSQSAPIDITLLYTDTSMRNVETWFSGGKPTQVLGDKDATLTFNLFDLKGNRAPENSNVTNISFRLKPWNSGDKTLSSEQHYDIEYVAMFNSLAEAEAYNGQSISGSVAKLDTNLTGKITDTYLTSGLKSIVVNYTFPETDENAQITMSAQTISAYLAKTQAPLTIKSRLGDITLDAATLRANAGGITVTFDATGAKLG